MMNHYKRTTAIILILLIVLTAATPLSAFSAQAGLLGDVDGNGMVEAVDVSLIQRDLSGLFWLDESGIAAGDVDNSDDVEITDVTFIQRFLAHMHTPFAIGEQNVYYRQERHCIADMLANRLDLERSSFYVYNDIGDAENHFPLRTKIADSYDPTGFVEFDENWTDNPYRSNTCIRCQTPCYSGSWVIWRMMNGYMTEDGQGPFINEGREPGQGMDLTGAIALRFYARGENGGETVTFSMGGFLPQDGDYPDTYSCSEKITLTDNWKLYVIPFNRFADLSSIANGFGFQVNGSDNPGKSSVAFYVDNITYMGDLNIRNEHPYLIRSYDTEKPELTNTAYTYDNALAAMAFLSTGRKDCAESILDAFVYAAEHDRYQNGRIRNAYIAGDISGFPGWQSGVRFPTFNKNGAWVEDASQVGCNVGNTSYAALAMLQYDKKYGTDRYLSAACALMDWVLDECTDAGDGFTAGYDGWPENGDVTRHTYKSTEHNIDAYAAFRQLYAVTGDDRYKTAAESALRFIRSMYSDEAGVFRTGTKDDGVTPDTETTVLDAQVWSALAMGEDFGPYEASLDAVASMKTAEGAYPFCQENKNGGFWCEGSAFTALMYQLRGEKENYVETMETLCGVQLYDGAFPAATVDHLSTGIYLSDGTPWEYGKDPHIAPAAWFVMAASGFNPYTF